MSEHESQAAGQPAIPIEVLQDRLAGLFPDSEHGDISDLHSTLYSSLCEVYEGVARWPAHETYIDGTQADHGGLIASECVELVCEHIVRRVHETGVAR